MPVDDPPSTEVVGGELDPDPVAREHADAVPPHLPGGVAERLVAVLEADLVHAVAERFENLAVELDLFLFTCHIVPCLRVPRASASGTRQSIGSVRRPRPAGRRTPRRPLRPRAARTRPSNPRRETCIPHR